MENYLELVIVSVGKAPPWGIQGGAAASLDLCDVGVKRRESNARVMKRHRKPNIWPDARLHSILPACVSFNTRDAPESS